MRALYRKYRPVKLDEVVGQPQVTEPLINALKQNKINHAYLFVGPRGTGKTSVARIFAHEVNGFKYEIEDSYVDIIEIDGASNRGIDNIRDLREKAMIAPTSGKYKIYIIDEVHMLTKEAFNALLKTLEEPPKHVIFIMATTDVYKVPITITSRAQTYTFKLADLNVMFDYLKSVSEKEKININDEALKVIVKLGGGSFRDSLSLLDQISTISNEEITKDLVIKTMGLPEDEKIDEILSAYLEKDVVKITTIYKDILKEGIKVDTLTEELIKNIIENPKPDYISLLSKLTDIKAPFIEAKLLVALTDNLLNFPVKKQASVTIQKSNTTVIKTKSFDKTNLLSVIEEKNEAIFLQLKRADFEVDNGVLKIFPNSRMAETILKNKNNYSILERTVDGFKIEIEPFGEKPKNIKNDKMIDRISDIMGGEVKKDGGENPF